MLGTPKLLTFAFRALVLLLFVILWLGVAREYNQALARLAGRMLPDNAVVWELGVEIVYESPVFSDKVAIDGLTLHFGLILLAVLVLAAVGIGLLPRLAWLVGMMSGAFVVHVGVVAILGRGLIWAAQTDSPESSTRFVLSLFAVFWGLVPPAVGGIWCFTYWLPRLRETGRQRLNPPCADVSLEQQRPDNGEPSL